MSLELLLFFLRNARDPEGFPKFCLWTDVASAML
jgi:hypothetical protein